VTVWKNAADIPDAELWRAHERLRESLVDFVRARLKKQLRAKGARAVEIEAADDVLDPQALTIGFARRFATYKRANMMLRDKQRLMKLLSDPKRPVQIIIAGKAHPRDNEGKKMIQELVELCKHPDCHNSMVFLEDYDMEVAGRMIQGCDVWLNTPRPPLEACGTSGMKAMVNGVLNLSTLDGWWAEAYRSDHSLGWSIGQGETYDDHEYQDFVESQTLYRIIEDNVAPSFYDRTRGNLPKRWVAKMKRGLLELGPVFNSHRMVAEYFEKAYLPSYENVRALAKDGFAPANELAAWRMDLMTKWDGVRIQHLDGEAAERTFTGEPVAVQAEVALGGLEPKDVSVEIYSGALDQSGQFAERHVTLMRHAKHLEEDRHLYKGEVIPDEPGRFGLTLRVLPCHPLLLDAHSLGLIRWAEG
jgi:starch phosphorylase